MRADSAGATHELIDYCRDGRLRFSVGYDLTEPVRDRDPRLDEDAWVPALNQDGERATTTAPRSPRSPTALDLSGWPAGSRVIVRRELPHPGAQLSLHRPRRPPLPGHPHRPARHRHRLPGGAPPRPRARRGPHPAGKDTGLAKLPFRDFAMNAVWLEIVADRPRPDRLDQGALPRRRARRLRAQAAALPAAARRRPARLPRPPSQAAPRPKLALGTRTRRRLRRASRRCHHQLADRFPTTRDPDPPRRRPHRPRQTPAIPTTRANRPPTDPQPPPRRQRRRRHHPRPPPATQTHRDRPNARSGLSILVNVASPPDPGNPVRTLTPKCHRRRRTTAESAADATLSSGNRTRRPTSPPFTSAGPADRTEPTALQAAALVRGDALLEQHERALAGAGRSILRST